MKNLFQFFRRPTNRNMQKQRSQFAAVELHCHLEATVSPEDARKIATRNNVDISQAFDETGGYEWRTFEEFLSVYDTVSEAIRTAEDYYEITLHHYRRMAKKGMIYGEVFVSPAHAMRFGLSYDSLIDAVASAMRDAENTCGCIGRIIITCVRHYGADHARDVAELAHKRKNAFVTGFGMAGDEAFGRAIDYKPAFEVARDAGLALTTHAGEVVGPESIRDAISILQVSRIGHGVRALDDLDLIAEIRDRQLTLEVCPTSNVAIGLYPSLREHPLPELLSAGLNVTINSDDPAFFGADVVDEYENAARLYGLGADQLRAITLTAIEAAFCDAETKKKLTRKVGRI